jgi:hypothetical protein
MTQTATMGPGEKPLKDFLFPLEANLAVRLRTLAHAWTTSGGSLLVGKLSIRLVGCDSAGRPFTAGTLHANQGGRPALELCKVLLLAHGVSAPAWQEWCDERPELRGHGFDPGAKFPLVGLDRLSDGALARLALGLRDLGLAVSRGAPEPRS